MKIIVKWLNESGAHPPWRSAFYVAPIENIVNVGVRLSARERDLLELLRLDGTLTAVRIAATYALSTRQAERLLTGLKKKGFLVRKGSNKGGHWEVVVA